ncbi:MAG: DUF4416 family protein [Candidatus Omnitrophica bacterium]|nr:DUF4416 family protein [Candidatus Omnitrophota bacterium]
MGRPKKHQPVKLVIGLIFKDINIYARAKQLLEVRFGPVDFESQVLDFNYTDYYEKELGRSLKRAFISFKKLILPQHLPAIKIIANRLETRLSLDKSRRINIDPGYLELPKFVLATTKDYSHRIYLGSGIYAEITLFYKGGSFCPAEWAYPDYRTDAYIQIFNKIREIYAQQVK